MSGDQYPWLRLRHRLKELPGIVLALLAGPQQRERLTWIVNHRQAQRAELERQQDG